MTRGRIVTVPFPFDGRSSTKLRPVLCLTEPIGPFRHIVLAFITSQTPVEPLPSDVLLHAEGAGFSETGLRVTSTVRLHRLLSVGAGEVQRDLGVLPPPLQADVDRRLRSLLRL